MKFKFDCIIHIAPHLQVLILVYSAPPLPTFLNQWYAYWKQIHEPNGIDVHLNSQPLLQTVFKLLCFKCITGNAVIWWCVCISTTTLLQRSSHAEIFSSFLQTYTFIAITRIYKKYLLHLTDFQNQFKSLLKLHLCKLISDDYALQSFIHILDILHCQFFQATTGLVSKALVWKPWR